MGKLATMIFRGALRLGVPLLASLLFFQTGCLYLTTVYADFEMDRRSNSNINQVMYSNHHHVSQVTLKNSYQPYLVGYQEEEGDEEGEEENGGDEEEDDFIEFIGQSGDGVSDNAIIIQDFISLSSSKVLMQVKASEGGDDQGYSFKRYSSTSSGSGKSLEVDGGEQEEDLKRLEKKFLRLFGMKGRPKRKEGGSDEVRKNEVPEKMLDLYEKQSGYDFPTGNLFLPGKLTRNANTVRVVHPMGKLNVFWKYFELWLVTYMHRLVVLLL